MIEIWKDIPGYSNVYQCSNLGRVKSLKRPYVVKDLIMKQNNHKGYMAIALGPDRKFLYIHILVAMTFLNHKPNGHYIEVDHKDDNRLNNRLDNLQLLEPRENTTKNRFWQNKTSQYTGVCWCKIRNKWRATIWFNGKQKSLGRFNDELDASNAYQKELARINKNS